MYEKYSFHYLLMYGCLAIGIGLIALALIQMIISGFNIFPLIILIGSFFAFIIFFSFRYSSDKSKDIYDEFKKLDEERRKDVEKAYEESSKR